MDAYPDAPPRPQNVGILAMEVYVPHMFVTQRDLEQYNNVPAGKYTIGLGQDAMAFTGDREDVNSIALTCVAGLLDKYDIDPRDIGRLEVGTETLVDKSKSTKTVLMQLFAASGNTDIEGATTLNACYGATAAVLNAIAWVESSAWDGRFAIVVAADIAVYADGPARPTGGCGGVAMLIGPDAPLAIDNRTRVTSASHVWDFYKPELDREYATVDGVLSQSCFINAIDDCYVRLCNKTEQFLQASTPTIAQIATTNKQNKFAVDAVDYCVFHSPYNKLVQKSFARLVFVDLWRQHHGRDIASDATAPPTLTKWLDKPLHETLVDRDLDLAMRALATDTYKRKVAPSCTASKRIGNAYCGSVYLNLATLVDAKASDLNNTRILLFSYGSGSIASMFTLRGRVTSDTTQRFSLARMASVLALDARLDARQQVSAAEYAVYMALRERVYGQQRNTTPQQSLTTIAPGAFYLEAVNSKYHRTYKQQQPLATSAADVNCNLSDAVQLVPVGASDNATNEQWDRAHAVVVAGVSALLPGTHASLQATSKSSQQQQQLELLLAGANCIESLAPAAVDAILAQNLVPRVAATKANVNEPTRLVDATDSVQVAARAPAIDLVAQYNIAPAVAHAMDASTQLAVAAGLDAMRDAGLVAAPHWRLDEHAAEATGIIYATSFPTTHAAVRAAAVDATTTPLDRKLLFQLLVLANAQLAQVTGARGPNTQLNAACAGTTQALSVAHDWLTLGKCTRVVVIASDVASNDVLLPFIAGGFRVLGAASTAATVEDAARPFDANRNGLVLSSGAVGIVLAAASARPVPQLQTAATPRVRLLATQTSNSAFHGASLKPAHVAQELVRFLMTVERSFGISRAAIAAHGVYYSHETGTNASPTASCAFAEVTALRAAFSATELTQLLVTNTKGATGHAMGVAFEDVAAVVGLQTGRVPPVVHFEQHDTHLGEPPLRLALRQDAGSDDGAIAYPHTYALRFAAGFGSQLAFALFALEPSST